MSNVMLGNVQYSILEPATFFKINNSCKEKPEWILMDGQNIAGSELFKLTGTSKVPDARGLFIRSMNMDQDRKKGDAEGNRSVGQYQKDTFESHTHPITNLGLNNMLCPHNSLAGAEFSQFGGGQLKDINQIIKNEPSGGNETRPRNIALYLYIKVN